MPTVPRVQRSIRPNALPQTGGVVTTTDLSAGVALQNANQAIGQQVARVGEQIADVGSRLYTTRRQVEHNELQKAKDTADQLVALDVSSKFGQWQRDNVYDTEKGALSVKGEASFALPEKVDAEFEKFADTVGKGLQNDEQRLAFEKMRQQAGEQTALTVRRHVDQQIERVATGKLKGAVENGIALAIAATNTPDGIKVIGDKLAEVETAIKTIAPKLGYVPEEVNAQVRDAKGQIHYGVVQQMLDTNRPKEAKAYFEANQQDLDETKRHSLFTQIENGDREAEAQKAADSIIKSNPTDVNKQREEAKKIEDPKVRTQALQLIEHEFSWNETQQRQAHQDEMTNAAQIIQQTGRFNSIPQGIRSRMSLGELQNFQEFERWKAKGVPVQTNPGKWFELAEMARTNPEQFMKTDLQGSYSGYINAEELQQFERLKTSLTQSSQKQSQELTEGLVTTAQIFGDTAKSINLKEGDEDWKQLRYQFNTMATSRQVALGRKLTTTEQQEVMDELAMNVVLKPGIFWDTKKRGYQITKDDIPAEFRPQILEALQKKGWPATDDNIRDAYLGYLQLQERNKGKQ